MISAFYHQQIPVFKFSNMLPSSVLMRGKKGGGAGTHFKIEPKKSLASECDIGVQSALPVCRSRNVDSEQDASSDS